jgi:hypothetical protein
MRKRAAQIMLPTAEDALQDSLRRFVQSASPRRVIFHSLLVQDCVTLHFSISCFQ